MAKKSAPPTVPRTTILSPSTSFDLTPAFHLVFLTIIALTVLSWAVSLGLSTWGRDNQSTERLIETCSTTWKMGLGAIVGMVGGRALT
jgi:hypothetical protein